MTINIDPVLFRVGPLALSWYALAVMAAFATGWWVTVREAKRRDLPTAPLADLAMAVLWGGLVGARLVHVLDRWEFYAAQPLQILAVHNGGLAILGGILGGALTGGLLARRQNLPVRALFDAATPGLVLGQAIGRLGCLVTGDALGAPTTAPWGITYLHPAAMAPQLGVAYQPVFLFEALWDLLLFVILWRVRGRVRGEGNLFALYLALYAIGKFSLTFLRTETLWIGGLQEAHLLSLVLLVGAGVWWGMGQRRGPRHASPA